MTEQLIFILTTDSLKRLALAAAFMGLLAIQGRADQIVMKNGDRLNGAIVKQDGKNLTIKTESLGLVTAPWSQIASVESTQPVTVVLKDGKSLKGTLSAQDDRVQVTGPSGSLTALAGEVAAIRDTAEQASYERLLNPGFGRLWTGLAAIGLSGTNGNAKTLTYTTAVKASRTTRTDKTSIYFNAIKATASVNGQNADTAEAVRGGWQYDRNAGGRFLVNAFNDYEYDRFQNLDLRFVVGAGVGIHAVKGERGKLDLMGGADYNRASFSTPLIRNSAEAFWGDEYSYKVNSTTTLNQTYRMFNNISKPGGYRVNFDLGLSTKLKKWLSWTVTLSDRFLSNPAPGRKSNDWLYTTGLGITFGH